MTCDTKFWLARGVKLVYFYGVNKSNYKALLGSRRFQLKDN